MCCMLRAMSTTEINRHGICASHAMQRVEKSIRVKAPVSRVYQLWRDFENFPRFMEHVEDVRALDPEGRRTHWQSHGPRGKKVEYHAFLTKDEQNRSIARYSREGGLWTTGNVTFSEELDNTLVHVSMQWHEVPGDSD